ncbi:hypothetical protein DSO57_1018325, partial [Entomophthora muscae]
DCAFSDIYALVSNCLVSHPIAQAIGNQAATLTTSGLGLRNVLSDPTDNNLPLGTSAEITPSLVLIGSPKMVGSVSSYCSILPEIVGFNIALDKGNLTPGFEPGSPAVCVNF